MSVIKEGKHLYRRAVRKIRTKKNQWIHGNHSMLHTGDRAYCRRITIGGQECVKKVFATSSVGQQAFASEKCAQALFGACKWMAPWLETGPNWFVRPLYPENSRLDHSAALLDEPTKREISGQVLSIILDLLVAGVAHRDLHAYNLFHVHGGLKLIDFEGMTSYSDTHRQRFSECYDITGHGLESPFRTGNMGFMADHVASVSRVLGAELDEAITELKRILREELHKASLAFQTGKRHRHSCKAQRTYSSFSLPRLTVEPSEAQRNSARRFTRFQVTDDAFKGKRLLDLGSNIGGMIFESQRFSPMECLGIEYDADKVAVSNRVAVFTELEHVRFLENDIDYLSPQAIAGPYDVVFCLAIDSHVKKRKRLYKLLGEVTSEVLYFEGNAHTNTSEVSLRLSAAGFKKIESLGLCDDDCVSTNNCRPLFRAWK